MSKGRPQFCLRWRLTDTVTDDNRNSHFYLKYYTLGTALNYFRHASLFILTKHLQVEHFLFHIAKDITEATKRSQGHVMEGLQFKYRPSYSKACVLNQFTFSFFASELKKKKSSQPPGRSSSVCRAEDVHVWISSSISNIRYASVVFRFLLLKTSK